MKSPRISFFLLLICVCSAISCGGSAPQTANQARANVNLNNESANISNSTVNTNMNTNITKFSEPPEVNKENLSNALKTRLNSDSKNEKILSEEEWKGDKWLTMPMGAFYKNVDKLIGNCVCEVTDELLKPHNRRLKASAKNSLRLKVKAATNCKTAVAEMRAAAINTEYIVLPK